MSMSPEQQALVKQAKRLIVPCLDKIVSAASARKYAKLRGDARQLMERLPQLLTAPPKPAKPGGWLHGARMCVRGRSLGGWVCTHARVLGALLRV